MKIQCKCGAVYNLSEKFAGKKVKCKKCGASFRVLSPSPTADASPLDLDPQQIGVPVNKPPSKKTAAQRKREREDALIAEHEKRSKAKGKSTEDFIADNFNDAFETKRRENAIYSICYGIACFVLAGVLFVVMNMLEKGGVAPAVIVYLTMIYGKWWVPPLVSLIGIYKLISGISDLAKTS